MTEPKPFTLHSGSNHLEGLAATYYVRKQRVSAIDNARDGVYLMRPQSDFGIHADESDMTSVVFAWTD